MLTYEDFQELVAKELDRTSGPPSRLKLEEPMFYVEWTSGGETGGSCWDEGESHHYSVSAEPEPEFDGLMGILEGLDIRLRHATAIMQDVVRGDYNEGGYYGNWTRNSYKYITVSSVADKLVEFGYVEPMPEASAAP